MSKFVIYEDAHELEIRCITDDGTEYSGLVTIDAEFDEWEKNGTSTFPQMQCIGINQVSVEDGNIMFALAMNHLKNIGMDRVKFMGNGKSEYFFAKLHTLQLLRYMISGSMKRILMNFSKRLER